MLMILLIWQVPDTVQRGGIGEGPGVFARAAVYDVAHGQFSGLLLDIVAQVLSRFDAQMLAYCLMGNHEHFWVAHSSGQSVAAHAPQQRRVYPVVQPPPQQS